MAALTAAVAGCTGSGDSGEPEETETPTDDPTPTDVPTPDPYVLSTGVPEPVVVDVIQGPSSFVAEVGNEGDWGEVGVGLVFTEGEYDDGWFSSEIVEARTTLKLLSGETESVKFDDEEPDVGEEYFRFRVWPNEVSAKIRNESEAAGTFVVTATNGSTEVASKEVEFDAGEKRTVRLETDFSAMNEEPRDVDVDVSVKN